MLLALFTYTSVERDFHAIWCSCRLTVIWRVSHVELELLTLTKHMGSARSLVFCATFCRSLFLLLLFFLWPLCCLFFFDWRIFVTYLVYSSSSFEKGRWNSGRFELWSTYIQLNRAFVSGGHHTWDGQDKIKRNKQNRLLLACNRLSPIWVLLWMVCLQRELKRKHITRIASSLHTLTMPYHWWWDMIEILLSYRNSPEVVVIVIAWKLDLHLPIQSMPITTKVVVRCTRYIFIR
jgi:hypothetical protein